jgi:hypothetical protein
MRPSTPATPTDIRRRRAPVRPARSRERVAAHFVHRGDGRLEEGMRSLGRPELATVVLAVIRGLLRDLDATGDTARTDRAFHDFLATIDSA